MDGWMDGWPERADVTRIDIIVVVLVIKKPVERVTPDAVICVLESCSEWIKVFTFKWIIYSFRCILKCIQLSNCEDAWYIPLIGWLWCKYMRSTLDVISLSSTCCVRCIFWDQFIGSRNRTTAKHHKHQTPCGYIHWIVGQWHGRRWWTMDKSNAYKYIYCIIDWRVGGVNSWLITTFLTMTIMRQKDRTTQWTTEQAAQCDSSECPFRLTIRMPIDAIVLWVCSLRNIIVLKRSSFYHL